MTRPPSDLLAIRDAQIRVCSCGNRVFGAHACPVCPLLVTETERVAS